MKLFNNLFFILSLHQLVQPQWVVAPVRPANYQHHVALELVVATWNNVKLLAVLQLPVAVLPVELVLVACGVSILMILPALKCKFCFFFLKTSVFFSIINFSNVYCFLLYYLQWSCPRFGYVSIVYCFSFYVAHLGQI